MILKLFQVAVIWFLVSNLHISSCKRMLQESEEQNDDEITSFKIEAFYYLYINLMKHDMSKSVTLGFPKITKEAIPSQMRLDHESYEQYSMSEEETNNKERLKLQESLFVNEELPHGLVGTNIELALKTKSYPWTNALPNEIFLEYVLPYATLNEPRTNWRPLFYEALQPMLSKLLQEQSTVLDVVLAVNSNIWSLFQKEIVFKEQQTPLIFDPMSTIAYGYASCTGLSIFFINALRAVGIAARLAGTPSWNGTGGNHSWVEVYIPFHKKWMFLEAAPAAGRIPPKNPSPCSFWFCKAAKFDGTTKVFASRLDTQKSINHFPLSWDFEDDSVPAVERSDVMNELCGKC